MDLLRLDSAMAQPGGRGGRGGRGGGFDRSNPFSLLKQDDVKSELKLTDDQYGQITKLEEEIQEEAKKAAADQSRPQSPPPQTNEERAAFFADFKKKQEERNTAAMAKIKSVLKDEQYQRLEQLRLQNVGLSALATEAISTELKISEQQQGELSKLLEESQAAQRSNYRDSPRRT